MIFNSYEFIFLFLPATLLGYFVLEHREKREAALAWLVAASLFFYGWWNPSYLGWILASVTFNYGVGTLLGKGYTPALRKAILSLGVSANLALLGYFKYANFFVHNLNTLLGFDFHLETILLPLAISFFTFQQIAFLVDAYRHETHEYHFIHYALFVTFFPQLIAGPIVHHKEILPQFATKKSHRFSYDHMAIGLSIFGIGLMKKVLFADSMAIVATPLFSAAEGGTILTFGEAWTAALAYTCQLYFDFSGYCDMAIGVARMFGIDLPVNFNSPYKSQSITEFWRRWHMTLSRFLRDYLYIPLGGNRKGTFRRYLNLMITMLLGGLWHGAGWTFVIWGLLHGAYLVINHGWQHLREATPFCRIRSSWITRSTATALTLLSVVIAWVFFRANSFASATSILSSMTGAHGLEWKSTLVNLRAARDNLLLLFGVLWFLPNTQEFMRRFYPLTLKPIPNPASWTVPLQFNLKRRYCLALSLLIFVSLLQMRTILKPEFLYYDF